MFMTFFRFLALFLLLVPGGGAALAQEGELKPGEHYWYVPEHEKYTRTVFYANPSFNSPQVYVGKAQRFKLVGARRGWAMLDFDFSREAYIHVRMLQTTMFDAQSADPWEEFKRASVFAEDPAKIEARLQRAKPAAVVKDSKTPAYKRYKESWNLKSATRAGVSGEADPESTGPTPGSGKTKPNRPMLPPIIGSGENAQGKPAPGAPADPAQPAPPGR